MMNKTLLILGIMLVSASISMAFFLNPNKNGTPPGCNCHSHSDLSIKASTDGMKIQVKINAPSGKNVAGELVNDKGTVVDFINSTKSNPFTLTAPSAGTYKINAGYISSSSGKVWDSVSVSIIPNDVNDNPPENRGFILYQNHPNPVEGGSTLIRYYLPEPSEVSLSLYDIRGNLILDLVNDNESEGFHQVMLNGDYIQAGTYEYMLRAGETSVSKKLIIVK